MMVLCPAMTVLTVKHVLRVLLHVLVRFLRLLLLTLAPQLLLLEMDVQLASFSHVLVVHARTAQQASTSLTQTTVVLVVMIVRQVHMQVTRALLSALHALQEQVRQTLVGLNVLLVPPESTVILPVRLVAPSVRLVNIHQIVGLQMLQHALIVLLILTLLMMLLHLVLIVLMAKRVRQAVPRALVFHHQ
jgi:hypothetical protein